GVTPNWARKASISPSNSLAVALMWAFYGELPIRQWASVDLPDRHHQPHGDGRQRQRTEPQGTARPAVPVRLRGGKALDRVVVEAEAAARHVGERQRRALGLVQRTRHLREHL